MGDSYIDLMWRVIKNKELLAAFDNLRDAREYSDKVGGEVIVISHSKVLK